MERWGIVRTSTGSMYVGAVQPPWLRFAGVLEQDLSRGSTGPILAKSPQE